MPLTRSFRKLVQRHVAGNPAYGEAWLRESSDSTLAGDAVPGNAILKDCIKATIKLSGVQQTVGVERL
jgi:hypothetical protein